MLEGWNWARSVLLGLTYFGQAPTQLRLQHNMHTVSAAAAGPGSAPRGSSVQTSQSTQHMQRGQMARPLTLQSQREGCHP